MYYKEYNGAIVCTKTDDGLITLFSPSHVAIADDDSVEWEHTNKTIVRLPDFSFVFDDDPRVFEVEKNKRIEALSNSFDVRVSGSFTTSQGYSMQFDTTDAIKMQGAIQLLEATGATEGYLTQADDTTVYHVPLETMRAVLVEMLTAYAACHGRKQELRALINSAQTAEELDEIVISWPV